MRRNPAKIKTWQEKSRSRQREKQSRNQQPTRKPLRRTPIRKVSARRAREGRIYTERRKVLLEANPWCALMLSMGKYVPATEVHHLQGREGELYLDESKWVALSDEGHRYIHDHPKWAKENGWQLSRHKSSNQEP